VSPRDSLRISAWRTLAESLAGAAQSRVVAVKPLARLDCC
jgi:hypothetical protein